MKTLSFRGENLGQTRPPGSRSEDRGRHPRPVFATPALPRQGEQVAATSAREDGQRCRAGSPGDGCSPRTPPRPPRRRGRKKTQHRAHAEKVVPTRSDRPGPVQQAGRAGAGSQQAAEGAVADQQQAVQDAPEDEGPARPVPQPAQRHGDQQVAARSASRAAAAAQRDEQVVAQPASRARCASAARTRRRWPTGTAC